MNYEDSGVGWVLKENIWILVWDRALTEWGEFSQIWQVFDDIDEFFFGILLNQGIGDLK